MEYCRVLAIDAGTRNFAYCVTDNNSWQAPLIWKSEDLWAPRPGRSIKPSIEDIVEITHNWCMRNRDMIRSCTLIVLERQMRKSFIVMNTVIQALFYDRTKVVHPMTVAQVFKLLKTRNEKKAATVEMCKRNCVMPVEHLKQDDLADAWMYCIWGMIQKNAFSMKSLL